MRSLWIAVCARHDRCSATRSAHFCNKRQHESCSQTVQRLPLSSRCLKRFRPPQHNLDGAHTHIHVVFLDWTLSPWHPERMLRVPAAESARLKVCEQDKLLRGVCSKSTPGLCSEINMWQSVCFGDVCFRKFSKPLSCVAARGWLRSLHPCSISAEIFLDISCCCVAPRMSHENGTGLHGTDVNLSPTESDLTRNLGEAIYFRAWRLNRIGILLAKYD